MKLVKSVKRRVSPYCHPELVSGSHRFYKGFTLMEMLVVVLIIGILGAIALPQYQRAVLKSRYAGLMPVAKSMADSNEAYYLEHGNYAENVTELPVQGQEEYPNGTKVELVSDTDYSYTLAYNDDTLPDNNYLAFQKHSPKFAGTTMCEARDAASAEICLALGGTDLDGGVTDGWTAYLLTGSINEITDYFPKSCDGNGELACECGKLIGSCNDRTGEWDYGGAFCPVKPDTTLKCTSGNAQMTREITCNAGEWQPGEWDDSACKPPFTGNQQYYNRTQQAKEYAQYWAAQIEAYYDQHGHYPYNGWKGNGNELKGYSWGTCYFNEGTPKAVYCNVDYLGTTGSAGGIGIVYKHSSSHGGDMYCWSRTTEPMDEVCRYEAGSAYNAGNRSYL